MLAQQKDGAFEQLEDELLSSIEALESIQFYRQVAGQMEQHRGILKLIKQKKRIQKELVNAQHVQKKNQVAILSEKLAAVEADLFDIPLYQQYLQATEDAQEDLDTISAYIEQELALKD
jgi:cell fate (sporulation/competence/biofilm development) regulator YmcA (YheA/YmcA/DUF963 family)